MSREPPALLLEDAMTCLGYVWYFRPVCLLGVGWSGVLLSPAKANRSIKSKSKKAGGKKTDNLVSMGKERRAHVFSGFYERKALVGDALQIVSSILPHRHQIRNCSEIVPRIPAGHVKA